MLPCRKLDPDLALKVPWTRQEDEQLLRLQAVHDNHWAEMAKHLRGRNAQMCRTRCLLCPRTIRCLIGFYNFCQIFLSTPSVMGRQTYLAYHRMPACISRVHSTTERTQSLLAGRSVVW